LIVKPLLKCDRWNYLSNGQQYLPKLFYGKGETQREKELTIGWTKKNNRKSMRKQEGDTHRTHWIKDKKTRC
jgi:hypothetical protein